jgi:hypothetical protein
VMVTNEKLKRGGLMSCGDTSLGAEGSVCVCNACLVRPQTRFLRSGVLS